MMLGNQVRLWEFDLKRKHASLIASLSVGAISVASFPLPLEIIEYTNLRVDHSPIEIHNNSDFLLQKSTNGWNGTGLLGNPIIISDYRINCTQIGISIENVDLYFMIVNCETSNYEYQYSNSIGIKIRNCTHGVIGESVANLKEIGILVENSNNMSLYRSVIHDCSTGMVIFNSTDFIIAHNNLSFNQNIGLVLNRTARCWADSNIILELPDCGIFCVIDNFTSLTGNQVSSTSLADNQFSHIGIVSLVSWNLLIDGTIIGYCAVGINLLATRDSVVQRSSISDCTVYGLYVENDSMNLTIVENEFQSTASTNAYDDGAENIWNGNYWSDYSGTGYYYILGSAESVDYNPRGPTTQTSPPVSTTTSPSQTSSIPPQTSTTIPPPPSSTGSGFPPNTLLIREVILIGIFLEIVIILIILSKRK
jgi:hypothetical protein